MHVAAYALQRLVSFQAGLAFTAAIAAVAIGMYMLPTIIGKFMHSPRMDTVVLVNIFLGWSVVGWIVALVLGAMKPRPPAAVPVVMVQQPWVVQYAPAPPPRPGPRP
jgi:multisubunit Na+/H+ antiporter MnhB subunit